MPRKTTKKMRSNGKTYRFWTDALNKNIINQEAKVLRKKNISYRIKKTKFTNVTGRKSTRYELYARGKR